jgi:hypothetical protein
MLFFHITKHTYKYISTLFTGQRCLFVCFFFVCLFVLVSKRYEKRYLVCLSPTNCQKGYWSVCHPTVRKDTGLSVTGAWEKIPGLSVTHGLSVIDMYDVSTLRKHKQTKINIYHKYFTLQNHLRLMPCIVGGAAPPPHPPARHSTFYFVHFSLSLWVVTWSSHESSPCSHM